ncbi:glycosyltransferase family 2 protein [Salipiger abyssi]|uniref:Glycosyl transferase family 2 n=1 Tax=Salipiger abyssi TaxID=1250539 RepID=A0A1P8UVP9_9RHOB|nr:glycosyltransferase family 2 protein [Salipiger abyssi]APZ53465.1 Glycosyl transferase family 2 [Salipiger abyssi]
MAHRIALATCMRNEGIFLLEWLAYHVALGFEQIVIVTNDCTDESDILLDLLAEHGLVRHIRQSVPPGGSPQNRGMDIVLRLARDEGLSHILHIDSDEFLYVPHGLSALLARTRDADVVPIPWRLFGDNGLSEWHPGDLVIECNVRAETAPEPGKAKSKCLFKVASFGRATDHNPRDPLVSDPLVLSPDGEELRNGTLYQPKSARFRPHDVATRAKTAQIFHYGVRSEDTFMMKNHRGDGQGKQGDTKYHIGSHWHRMANINETAAPEMAAYLPALKKRLAKWRAVPEIARAEHACQDRFRQDRAQFLTAENIAARTRGKAPPPLDHGTSRSRQAARSPAALRGHPHDPSERSRVKPGRGGAR